MIRIIKVITVALKKALQTSFLALGIQLPLLVYQSQPAKALLTYYVYENAGNVIAETRGSLNLTNAVQAGTDYCWNGSGNPVDSGTARNFNLLLCTGLDITDRYFDIFGTDANTINSSSPQTTSGPTGLYSGIGLMLAPGGTGGRFVIDSAYLSGTPILSSATFPGTTLPAMGMTSTGLVGTWFLSTDSTQQIDVRIGSAPPADSAAVPGPLPLMGAAAAFGFSRRLRRRMGYGLSSGPQV